MKANKFLSKSAFYQLPNDTPAKFYLSSTFGLSFMINSVAPARSSTPYMYLRSPDDA